MGERALPTAIRKNRAMRRGPTCRTLLGASVAALSVLAGCGGGGGGSSPSTDRAPILGGDPLNVVVLMTDDQSSDPRELRIMPHVRHLIGEEGADFTRFYTSYPLCCPSRTTFLAGQFAHNSGVQGNFPDEDGGGYLNLRDPERTLPAWLHAAGYRTDQVGKWAEFPPPGTPPGWDRWLATTQDTIAHYYDFTLHSGGDSTRRLGDATRDYNTSVLTRISTRMIRSHAASRRPLFLYVAYTAPHFGFGRSDAASSRCGSVPNGQPAGQTAVPAPRDANAFEHARLPRSPSFDEGEVSDKPLFERRHRLKPSEIAEETVDYQCRLASLLAVDRSVARIVDTLKASGTLDNTMIVFTSDNGFMLGQHRETVGKNLPYEEAIRVPLLIRAPQIPPGTRVTSPTVNADLAPTILDATGVSQPAGLQRPEDGRSLLPLADGKRSAPNRVVLIEGRNDASETNGGEFQARSYIGVRTNRYLYVQWHRRLATDSASAAAAPIGAGSIDAAELYDMRRDPYQLRNLAHSAAYAAPRRALRKALDSLQQCSGASCWLEQTIPPPGGSH